MGIAFILPSAADDVHQADWIDWRLDCIEGGGER